MTEERHRTTALPVVLSGAGLSADFPTCAPLGDRLRDGYLGEIARAGSFHDAIEAGRLQSLPIYSRLEGWRLEVVLGILRDVVQERAFSPLVGLVRGKPNEAHRLAARLLETQGAPRVHLTLNFDDYVERAYEMEFGRLPKVLTPADEDGLTELGGLSWTDLQIPVIVHLHGCVDVSGDRPTFPGLVATLRTISGPAPAPIERLIEKAAEGPLLVTGYSGFDTDIWPVLLAATAAVARNDRVWNSLDAFTGSSELGGVLSGRGFSSSGKGAVAALAKVLQMHPPAVPKCPGDRSFPVSVSLHRSEADVTCAWICEDAGARKLALSIVDSPIPVDAPTRARWLSMYKRGIIRHEVGRHRDGLRYLRAARRAATTRGERAETLVTQADSCRHLMFASAPLSRPAYAVRFVAYVVAARVAARRCEDCGDIAQRADRITGHALLRTLDRLAYLAGTAPLRRYLAARAIIHLRRASGGGDPHSRLFAQLQLAEALAHARLAGSHGIEYAEMRAALDAASPLVEFVKHGLAVGNFECAEALVAVANREYGEALVHLAKAEASYAREDHQSGLDLARARRRLLDREVPPTARI